MRKALVVLGLEVAVLAVVVLAYLVSEGPGVQAPASIPTATALPAARPAASVVPVSISLTNPIGSVETATLTRGGHASATAIHGRVAVKVRAAAARTTTTTTTSRAGLAASRRARGPCC
jgi:hypothetical protein